MTFSPPPKEVIFEMDPEREVEMRTALHAETDQREDDMSSLFKYHIRQQSSFVEMQGGYGGTMENRAIHING